MIPVKVVAADVVVRFFVAETVPVIVVAELGAVSVTTTFPAASVVPNAAERDPVLAAKSTREFGIAAPPLDFVSLAVTVIWVAPSALTVAGEGLVVSVRFVAVA